MRPERSDDDQEPTEALVRLMRGDFSGEPEGEPFAYSNLGEQANDLGNTPAAQEQMDALCQQHDDALVQLAAALRQMGRPQREWFGLWSEWQGVAKAYDKALAALEKL